MNFLIRRFIATYVRRLVQTGIWVEVESLKPDEGHEEGLLRWLPTIPENVKLLRTHSPVTKFILNTPKTGQCEYFQEKHEGHYCTYNEK